MNKSHCKGRALLEVCAMGVFQTNQVWFLCVCFPGECMNIRGIIFCLFIFPLQADSSALSLPSSVLCQYSVYLPGWPQQPLQQQRILMPFGERLQERSRDGSVAIGAMAIPSL